MESHLLIEPVPVLTPVQIPIEHPVGDPALSILQCVVSSKSTTPSGRLLGLQVLLSLSEGGVHLSPGVSEEIVGGGLELVGVPGGVGSLYGCLAVFA